MSQNVSCAVVVRCFNEDAGVVRDNLRALDDRLRGTVGERLLIVLVDDGSAAPIDGAATGSPHAELKLVRHCVNLGAGAALETGFEFIRRNCPQVDWVATFDPDGQHRPEDLKNMLEYAAHHCKFPRDIGFAVFGSRFLGNVENIDKSRLWVLRLARAFTNLFYGMRLTDVHNGLRVFSRKAVELLRLRSADFAYASELLQLVKLHNIHVRERPVLISYSAYSKSKGQKNLNSFSILKNMLLRWLVP